MSRGRGSRKSENRKHNMRREMRVGKKKKEKE